MFYFIIFIKKKHIKISGTYICNRNNENEHLNNIVYHITFYNRSNNKHKYDKWECQN